MWWIAFVVFGVIALIVIIIVIVASVNNDHSDYNDGGGTQVGGDERIPFFMPRNERAGILGERFVNNRLLPLLKDDEYLLANLLLPLRNGHKTEIDCVLISRKGIFCIETKNWVGHISGSDEDEYWTQSYDDIFKRNKEHKNPVKQNEKHCEILERKLNNHYRVENIVIFVALEDGRGIDSDYAFTLREFKDYYQELSDDEINVPNLRIIYQQLVGFVATTEELEKHKEETRTRFDN